MGRILLVAVLLSGLSGTVSEVAWSAAPAKPAGGPQPKAAATTVADLMGQLGSEDPKQRREAAIALGKLGADAAAALQSLVEVSTKDEFVTVRQAAKASADKIRSAQAKAAPKNQTPAKPSKTEANFVYQGKPASVWIRQLNSPEPDERTALITALIAFGPEYPNTVPALVGLLQRDRVAGIRAAAANALGGLGPSAKPAVPVLTAATSDPDPVVRLEAIRALGKLGTIAKPAAPVLLAQMRTAPPQILPIMAEVVMALGGGSFKPLMPRLLVLLRDKEPDIRAAALDVMGYMRADAAPEIPRMLALIDDPSSTVAESATQALARLTPEVVPELVSALTAEGMTEARKLFVLTQLVEVPDKVGGPAVPTLLKLSADKSVGVSAAAEKVLSRIGPVAVAKMTELLRSEDYATRRGAAVFLLKQGPVATRGAVRDLIPLLLDPDSAMRNSVRAGLLALQSDGLAAITEVARDTKAKPELRVAAIGMLSSFGPDRMPAGLTTALSLTQDAEPTVLTAAARLIAEQKRASDDLLLAALQNNDTEKVAAALNVLATLTHGSKWSGLSDEFVAPLMTKALDENSALAKLATELLLKCPTKPVLSALEEGLASPEKVRRRRSAELLGQLGSAAAPALLVLKVAAEDVEPDVAAAAAEAIKKIMM